MNTEKEVTAPVTKEAEVAEKSVGPNGSTPSEPVDKAKVEAKAKEAPAEKTKGKSSKKAEAKGDSPKKGKAKGSDKADKGKTAKAGNGKAKADKKATDKADKPKKQPVERDRWGFKANSLKSRAAAMYASKKSKGSTLAEVKGELKSSQLNLIKELEQAGHKVIRNKEAGKGKKPVTRYWLIHKDDKDTLKASKEAKSGNGKKSKKDKAAKKEQVAA